MSSLALAAPINYGNKSGLTVDYISIEEDSGTDPQYFPPFEFPPSPNAGLFREPSVSGDSLEFTPLNFYADSDHGVPATDLTDGYLTFGVDAKTGYAVEKIKFSEGGSFTVNGIGTDITWIDISAVGTVTVLAVDGAAINSVAIPIMLTFSHGDNAGDFDNGVWKLASQGPVTGLAWTGAQEIDIKQWLIDNTDIDPEFGATKLTVSLDNVLYAESESGTHAFVDKKVFGGLSVTVETGVIPEPATWVLGMLGSVLFAVRRRRG